MFPRLSSVFIVFRAFLFFHPSLRFPFTFSPRCYDFSSLSSFPSFSSVFHVFFFKKKIVFHFCFPVLLILRFFFVFLCFVCFLFFFFCLLCFLFLLSFCEDPQFQQLTECTLRRHKTPEQGTVAIQFVPS